MTQPQIEPLAPREHLGTIHRGVPSVVAQCAALLVATTVVASCSSDEAAGRPRVVATTGMIGDVARALAGERLFVTTLLGPGVDPHLYRPNRDDVAQALAAGLVLHNGLHLEGRMGDTLRDLVSSTPSSAAPRNEGGRPRVIAFAEALEGESAPGLALLSGDEHGGQNADPHVWMDPLRWARCAELLAPALVELVPAHERDAARQEIFSSSLPNFRATAEALIGFGDACFATIPERARVLVTAHDAFRYLGDRFGLEVVGLQGISTESEAGVRHIEALVDLVVERRIPAVFAESSVPDRALRALVEGARARGHSVELGRELFSDAMGDPGTAQGTYFGMIEHNIMRITRGLGGRVPGGSFAVWRSAQEGVRFDPLAPLEPQPSALAPLAADAVGHAPRTVGVSGDGAPEGGR